MDTCAKVWWVVSEEYVAHGAAEPWLSAVLSWQASPRVSTIDYLIIWGRVPDRDYFFNVMATVAPDYVKSLIEYANNQRHAAGAKHTED